MNKRILIVEDERSVWKQLSILLKGERYELEWTRTGHEALRRSLDERFELVILDIGLSDMDGWKALDWFYRLHPFLPLIALTSNVEGNEQASLLGASACVVKPVDEDALVRTIEGLLAESPQERITRSMESLGGSIHVPQANPVTVA